MPEDNVVMGQKISICLHYQENIRSYIAKVHVENETWQKFCIKISGYFQSNIQDNTSDLREEMRHHTADSTDGMLHLGKDDMVSTILV
jgi:hypothetical protein